MILRFGNLMSEDMIHVKSMNYFDNCMNEDINDLFNEEKKNIL